MSAKHDREEMLKDLQIIKAAVSKDNNMLKYINLLDAIRGVALYSGILIFVFCVSLLKLMDHYGSYHSLPADIKFVFYIVLGVCVLVIGIVKLRTLLKFARKYHKDISLAKLIREIYTQSFLMITTSFVMALLVLLIYFATADLAYLIVPMIAIIVALLMTAFVAVLNLNEMLIYVEWLLVSGLFSLFIADRINSLVILMLTFGVGMIILYLIALSSSLTEKRE